MKKVIYTPLTATPLLSSSTYREVPPQNPELARYVRCFWGSEKPYFRQDASGGRTLVTPDTCADIIYEIDFTENTIKGNFCGINDASFFSCDSGGHEGGKGGYCVSTFAIRFYGWGACAFSEDSLKDTLNGFPEAESRFQWLDRELRQQLFEKDSLTERARIAEKLLLQRLAQRERQNAVVGHAVGEMILRKGTMGTAWLAGECGVSTRQLERLFHEYVGITPKKLGNLIRYQFLWNDIFRNPEFHVLDGVHKYGFTDQSHLLREFKRYHTMDIRTAKDYAHHVGNLQYNAGGQ